MELFDEQIEQVIISKEYFELTPEEKEGMKDFISNEEEYAQFKATLLMASELPKENIKPREETKASLMSMMESSRPERKIWYNSIGLFLFPEDKPAFAKPGVYASLAAILLLVFFFVPMDFGTVGSNNDVTAKEENRSADDSKDMAPTEESIVSGESEPTAKMTPEGGLNQNLEIKEEFKKTEEFEMADNEILEEDAGNLDDNMAFGANGGGEINEQNKNVGAQNNGTITIDYAARMNNNDGKKAMMKGGAVADSTVNNNSVPGNFAMAADKDVRFKDDQKNFISGDLKKDGFTYEILNDNALNQSNDLIDLLYTAD